MRTRLDIFHPNLSAQELLRHIMEVASTAFFLLDEEGKIIYLNPTAEEKTGYKLSESVGKTMHELIHHSHPDGSPYPIQECPIYQSMLTERTSHQHENTFIRKDGTNLQALHAISPILKDDMATGFIVELRDITREKQAQEALLKSEERFRLVVEGSNDGLWDWDHRTDRLFWNKRCYDDVGLPYDMPISGEIFFSLIHPDDKAKSLTVIRNHLEHNTPCEVEFRLRHTSGEYRYFYARGNTIRDENGQPLRTSGMRTDITRLKQTEEALRKSEAKYRSLVESGLMGILISDIKGNLVEVNDAYLDMVGFTRDEFERGELQWEELTPLEYLEMEWKTIQETVETGVCKPYEKQYRKRNGELVDVLIGYALIDNKREHAICYVIDITERKKAERAVQESEERFRLMADASPVMIWQTDATGRAIYHNKTFLEYTGKTLAEIEAESWEPLIHSDDLDQVWSTFRQALQEHAHYRTEHRIRSASGEFRWFLTSAAPRFNTNGEFLGYIGSVADIHDLKEAEHELKNYATRLEQSNRDLEQFATIASHDLQEPLRKVQFFGGLLADMAGEKGADYAERLNSATVRMQSLMTDLLTLSRINRNQMPFKKVNLNEIIQSTLSDLELLIRESKAQVHCDSLSTIEADQNQLGQLFQNLLSNAIKFISAGKTPEIRISGKKSDSHYEISIEDNGIGFRQEFAARIFEPFERLHGKSHYPGTGMGLAICKKIVERHQGQIQAFSQEGKGSRFVITLPIRQKDCNSAG